MVSKAFVKDLNLNMEKCSSCYQGPLVKGEQKFQDMVVCKTSLSIQKYYKDEIM